MGLTKTLSKVAQHTQRVCKTMEEKAFENYESGFQSRRSASGNGEELRVSAQKTNDGIATDTVFGPEVLFHAIVKEITAYQFDLAARKRVCESLEGEVQIEKTKVEDRRKRLENTVRDLEREGVRVHAAIEGQMTHLMEQKRAKETGLTSSLNNTESHQSRKTLPSEEVLQKRITQESTKLEELRYRGWTKFGPPIMTIYSKAELTWTLTSLRARPIAQHKNRPPMFRQCEKSYQLNIGGRLLCVRSIWSPSKFYMLSVYCFERGGVANFVHRLYANRSLADRICEQKEAYAKLDEESDELDTQIAESIYRVQQAWCEFAQTEAFWRRRMTTIDEQIQGHQDILTQIGRELAELKAEVNTLKEEKNTAQEKRPVQAELYEARGSAQHVAHLQKILFDTKAEVQDLRDNLVRAIGTVARSPT